MSGSIYLLTAGPVPLALALCKRFAAAAATTAAAAALHSARRQWAQSRRTLRLMRRRRRSVRLRLAMCGRTHVRARGAGRL